MLSRAVFVSLSVGLALGISGSLTGCANGNAGSPDSGRVPRDAGSTPDAGRPTDASTAPDAGNSCGDGVIQGREECDGTQLNAATCVSEGYLSGTIACNDDCTLDKSMCVESVCGNGRLDAREDCDGRNLAGARCATQGFVSGELRCGADCLFDTSGCTACGNGALDMGEECDGTLLNGATCAARGFTGGTLSCSPTCAFNDSACTRATCGNRTRDSGEDCDGADVGGRSCASLGYASGTLGCNSGCTFDLAACTNCGNGRVDGSESCDGSALGGQTCASRGFTAGTLGCTAACAFDTARCTTSACGNGRMQSGEACDDGNADDADGCSARCTVETGFACTGMPSSCTAVCGDGRIVVSESCDGTMLMGATCASQGFPGGGTLTCRASNCTFDTSACRATTCGNSTIDTGEECDDGNTVSNDGCTSSCQVDPGFYLPLRLRNGEGTNHGMLEVYYSGGWRDVCDDTYDAAAQQAMANLVCRNLGFTGTGHQFLNAFGGGSGTPAMDDVNCTGTEADLSQCAFAGWNVENCSASEAVGIRCVPGEGDVRLVGGPSGMEGRLQVFHASAWGEVCDDYFDGNYSGTYFGYSTTTVCQQMGYRGGAFVGTYDAPSNDFVLDDVNCTGTERRIADCPHSAYGTENCFTSEGAGFRCDAYANDDVRLTGGSGRNNGRVEVLHNSVWGTVCDDFISTAGTWQTQFVAVTCGQLGFSSRTGAALLAMSVPDGIDPTWLDDVSCGGTETTLPMCMSAGWGIENCSHSEDIGVNCTP